MCLPSHKIGKNVHVGAAMLQTCCQACASLCSWPLDEDLFSSLGALQSEASPAIDPFREPSIANAEPIEQQIQCQRHAASPEPSQRSPGAYLPLHIEYYCPGTYSASLHAEGVFLYIRGQYLPVNSYGAGGLPGISNLDGKRRKRITRQIGAGKGDGVVQSVPKPRSPGSAMQFKAPDMPAAQVKRLSLESTC